MASSDINIIGLGELKGDLHSIADKLTRAQLIKFLQPGAKLFRQAVRNRAPVDEGDVKKSLRVRAAKGAAKEPKAAVTVYLAKVARGPKGEKVKPYWAWFVHNGTLAASKKKRKHHKPRLYSNTEKLAYVFERGGYRIKPNPFVYEAFEMTVQKAADIILSTIGNSL